MKILIDTHLFLWMLSYPEKFDEKRRFELESRSNEIFLRAMSIAELMVKHSIGKIHIDFNPVLLAEKTGIEILSFSGAEALLLGQLPMHHKDPFDRTIIAQSIANGLPVMSDDPKFLKYDCKVI